MQPSYQQTLDYLFQQLPMFQRIGPPAFKKDLKNTIALSDALGNPHQHFPSIHIAGTNGKGSTAHMIAAVLQASGLRVGLYTSPHYRDFRERIKINGQYISEKAVIEFVSQNKAQFEPIQPSFFEITVVMAFHYFATQNVDFAVIETGLGGRLDSTNIISPLLSVITNIGFDHTNFLGDTLPLIAGEKAGIIKPKTPVVIGQTHPETRPVFEAKAEQESAPIFFADQHFLADLQTLEAPFAFYDIYKNNQPYYQKLKLQALGSYQQHNLCTVLQAIELLQPTFDLTEEHARYGLQNLQSSTNFMGRWQILGTSPLIIADSAHNTEGLTVAMQQLKRTPKQQLHFVLGMVNDKDRSKMLALLPKDANYYFAKPDIPRGLDSQALQDEAASFGLNGQTYPSVPLALETAKQQAQAEDCIYVGGSTFVVAEVV